MNRTDKQEQVEAMRERFQRARHAFVVDFKGLNVEADTELRRKLREAQADYRVVKNRLARLAMQDTLLAGLDPHFVGPTAVALGDDDPVALAKVLVSFAKDNAALEIKAGVLEGGHQMDAGQVKALSELPALPALQAQLLSLIQTPATSLATVLAQPGVQIARVIDARRESMPAST